MNKKLIISSTLLFILLTCTIYPDIGSGEDVTQRIEDERDKSYNPELYGNFLNNSYNIYRVGPMSFNGQKKGTVELSLGEEITIPIFITRDISFSPVGMNKGSINDVYIKFILVNKEDWVPEKAKLKSIDTFDKTNMEIGMNHEERIKFQDKWFKNLRDKTKNIYELDYETIHYTEKNTVNKTFSKDENLFNLTGMVANVSISIEQAGFWSLSTMIKPVGGQYWVYAGRRNITLKVEKPSDIISRSLPIFAPGSIAGGAIIWTYSIKKRKKWF